MSPILHGIDGSPYVRKVLIALAEKGVAFEHDPIIPFGVSDDYKKKSPLGKIPCYEDGDLVLPDSSCILAYLERVHPKPPLYPSDPKLFARALWYEEYSDTKLTETVAPIFFERYVKKNLMKQDADPERVAAAFEALPPVFDYVQEEVAGREYLVGDRFSVADIAVGSILVNFGLAGEKVDPARWPGLAAYAERIHARPSFAKQIAKEQGR